MGSHILDAQATFRNGFGDFVPGNWMKPLYRIDIGPQKYDIDAVNLLDDLAWNKKMPKLINWDYRGDRLIRMRRSAGDRSPFSIL